MVEPKLSLRCPRCDSEVREGIERCVKCGASFAPKKLELFTPAKIVALVFIVIVFAYVAQIFLSIGGALSF